MSGPAKPNQQRIAIQRDIARIALARAADLGFALAGSGAIREHGITERPTEDVDLFTTSQFSAEFDRAVEQTTTDSQGHGFRVETTRHATQFVRLALIAPGGDEFQLDLGVDWRAEEPVTLDVGPVLSLNDAAGNKVSALYGRAEPRDYLDVDALRASGKFTDAQLIAEAAERDPGFEVRLEADQVPADAP